MVLLGLWLLEWRAMNFEDKIAAMGILVLDGGLASELERRGCNLDSKLWSAAILDRQPDAIRDVHRAYLDAGADCIASSSYQASVPGFRAAGFAIDKSEALYRLSIRLPYEARDAFCTARGIATDSLRAPLVATSIGPYGAYLADGSEYRGNYQVSSDELRRFHAERLALAIDELKQLTDHPLLAFETIPSLHEALLLTELLADHPDVQAWISFSCATPDATSEGQPIAECLSALDDAGLAAIGVNCSAPDLMPAAIRGFAAGNTAVIAYPNSGETYDARQKRWSGVGDLEQAHGDFEDWALAGATVLGGCCRTTPEWIATLVAWRTSRGTATSSP